MKKYILTISGIAILATFSLKGWAESWEHEHEEQQRYTQATPTHSTTQGKKDYRKECAACHIAYPANFLPARSWQSLLNHLDQHFGENAELDAEDRQHILTYLTDHASDHSQSRLAAWINRSISPNKTPLRITETRYFDRLHDEVPARFVSGNPKVRSFSNCIACHRGANIGDFDEDRVIIPGVRRWED
ncbi:MAG: diheme cytochrome c [Mariprofundaceae bacterium]|nr:diheme cytochrome c [Mariprofundaceae bacterium]